jgi:hypothetical protein
MMAMPKAEKQRTQPQTDEPKPVPAPMISGTLSFFDERPSGQRVSGERWSMERITSSMRIVLADPVRRERLRKVVMWTMAGAALIVVLAILRSLIA